MSGAGLALLGLAAAGCAAFAPGSLDVPPGQRAVLGRIDLDAFEVPQGTLDIVKDDGTFTATVSVGPGRRDFAVALPPGRYRITRIAAAKERESSPDVFSWPLRAAFEVGAEPAVYVGTLRLISRMGGSLQASVVDEFDDTLRTLRRLYTDLPEPVTRRLLTPA